MKKRGATLKRFYAAIHDDLIVAMTSLLILSVVDLIGINAFLLSITVDAFTTAQFVALSFVAVFFKVIARSKRQNGAWFFWTLITFFGGFMFMINTIVIQGDDQKPAYVSRAESAYRSAGDELDRLLKQQEDMRSAENNRLTAARDMEPSITAARSDLDTRRKEVETAEARWKAEPEIKPRALDIFGRIPYIMRNPSSAIIIASIFFIVFYGSIEWSIFTIAGEIGRPVEKKPRTVKAPRTRAAVEEHFGDVTDDEYRASAEYADGSVRLPEEVARDLKISRDEADRIHARLYAGYIYRDGRYARIGVSS